MSDIARATVLSRADSFPDQESHKQHPNDFEHPIDFRLSSVVIITRFLKVATKPAQLIRVTHLQSAHEIWQRLADEYGRISELKLAQLQTKLRSLRKSSSISVQSHVGEFERIQREIEFQNL